MDSATAYPLSWPVGRRRTECRRGSPFRNWNLGRVRDDLVSELRKMSAEDVVISTDLRLRHDGLPRASQRKPDDPGVAVYFRKNQKPYVIACDQYTTIEANIRALVVTIEAMRKIERHGSTELAEQALGGFRALPPHQECEEHWTTVLGLPDPPRYYGHVLTTYRKLAHEWHPDRQGGDTKLFLKLRAALDAAREHYGV